MPTDQPHPPAGPAAQHQLSDVLERLQGSIDGDSVSIGHIVETLGAKSFAALMLIFALISTSPASAIPGVTTLVAVVVLILSVQMMAGRSSVWLPAILTRRRLDSDKLGRGIRWLRRPVATVERFLRPRLTLLCHRPWLWLPLSLIALLTLCMPFMEVIPTSGSLASAAIALCAAGLLVRDGVLVILSLVPLMALPLAIYLFAFAG